MGIEPTLSAWEAEVLPLNYTRDMATHFTKMAERGQSLFSAAIKTPFINLNLGFLLHARNEFYGIAFEKSHW